MALFFLARKLDWSHTEEYGENCDNHNTGAKGANAGDQQTLR
jgi:hypothetical protein